MHLVLIDGSAFLHRAFHIAPKNMIRADGVQIGAINLFCGMLWRIVGKFDHATHLAVIGDAGGKTWRHAVDRQYKANRGPREAELKAQLEMVEKAVQAFGLPYIARAGVEADDIIATYVKAWDNTEPKDTRNPLTYSEPSTWINPTFHSEPNDYRNPERHSEPKTNRNPQANSVPASGRNPTKDSEPASSRNPRTFSEPRRDRNPELANEPTSSSNPATESEPKTARTPSTDSEPQTRLVTIISSDKDLMQLVTDRVILFEPRDERFIRAADVVAKFGVEPWQMVDYLAMVGDTSDNIRGVPSIGEKTASALLAIYGSVDGIYDHLDMLNPRQQAVILHNQIELTRSQRLVRLKADLDGLPDVETFSFDRP